jgi:hypothetical protein
MGLKFSEQLLTSGRKTNAHEFDGYAVTPNDTLATYQQQVPFTNGVGIPCDALYVTTGGTVALVLDAAGNTATLTVASGSLIPIAALQVKATGTTASGIYSLHRIQ